MRYNDSNAWLFILSFQVYKIKSTFVKSHQQQNIHTTVRMSSKHCLELFDFKQYIVFVRDMY